MRRIGMFVLAWLVAASAVLGLGRVAAQANVTAETTTLMQLRVGPGTKFTALGTVPAGTVLPAIARDATTKWLKVTYQNQQGWLALAYLRYRGDLAALPVGDVVQQPAPTQQGGGQGGGQPAVQPTGNGAIVVMERYFQSDRVDYYRIIYLSDGLRISAFYAEPRTYGKFAAVIYNRGGNRSTGALTGYEFVPFAEVGFVVIASQYRGGGGSEGYDNFGGADVDDVLNAIPLLKSRDKVDPNRITMFGSSRGAMMTYIALRRLGQAGSNDIKVASTTSGLADLFMWDTERRDYTKTLYPELIGATGGNALIERSATYWPTLIRVPLLMQHGSSDAIVSVKQSEKLYVGMLKANLPVKLIVQPGGDHGLNNYDTGMPETFKWFTQYVGRGEGWDYYAYKDVIYKVMRGIRGQ